MKRISQSLAILVFLAGISCGPRGEQPSGSSAAPSNPKGSVELSFTYSSEKEEWIRTVTEAFNSEDHKLADGRSIVVQAIPMGSGDCIDELLNETRKADITSPASAAFIKLGNAQSRVKTGKDLIGPTESLVVSPVVIAMWKPMAEALGWPNQSIGWSDILQLARDQRGWASKGHPEWGPFRFGHTSPDSSNSGLIAMFAEVYAAAGKKASLTLEDVNAPHTADFVSGIESAVVHYGTSTGFFGKKMFTNGPQYLSAAVLYENMVIESYSGKYQTPFPVVAVYPREGTFWSDHPVGVVNREWVTGEKREAAKIYIDHLLAREQQARALPFGFRPASVDVPLGAPMDAAHGVNPKEPQSTLEVPSTEVMDAILKLWRAHKKHSHVTLVFDVSGSMNDSGKMEGARAGALQLLALLGDEDQFSILPFSGRPTWALQRASLKTSRTRAAQTLSGLYASGGTALYDAISEAYAAHMATADEDAGRISAIVVLTDGADTDSKMSLDQLLPSIRFDNERHTIRVFTIAYGNDARKDILQKIADTTQAKSSEGDPKNIRAVLREISTFF